MNPWHSDKTKEIEGAHKDLTGNLKAIRGDRSEVWGQCLISGDVSGLQGCLAGLTGSCEGLSGDLSNLRGNLSGITGLVDANLIGDVSGLHGDVSGVWGKADRLRGVVAELLEQGLLWHKDQPLSLEMFASRYNLPMEFLDNSGMPALIAFHALEGAGLHWVTVRTGSAGGFIVGALLVIAGRFPGQEIIKVAVPGDADWQLMEGFDVLNADRIYAFEQLGSPVNSILN